MLKRNGLIKKVEKLFNKIVINQKEINTLAQDISEKHNIFPDEVVQYITKMRPMEEIRDELLYWIVESGNALGLTNIPLKEYYSDKEMELYKVLKDTSKEENIYPVTIANVLPVDYDQWVTIVDVDTLFKWYRNHLITYNPRTQRQLRKIGSKESIHYTINVVKKSVREIEKSLEQGLFIPNDLSLNINIDNPTIDYKVDGNEIIINKGQLDLIDGYHRFLAAINVKIRNPDFKFTFIVNIMNFDEDKACHFIAQEDKRNPILKSVTESMDAMNNVNVIVKRLNEQPDSPYYGKLGRAGLGKIDSVLLTTLLSIFYPEAIDNRNYAMGLVKKISNLTTEIESICNLDLSNDEDLICLIAISSITDDGSTAVDYIKELKSSSDYQDIMEKRAGSTQKAKLRKIKGLLEGRY